MLGQGNGNMTGPTMFGNKALGWGFATADFNNDGKPDLMYSEGPTVYVMDQY